MMESYTLEQIDTQVLQQITTQQAWHYQIIPFRSEGAAIHLYTIQQDTIDQLQEELELLFGKEIHLEYIEADQLQRALGRYYRKGNQENKNSQKILFSNHKTNFLEQLIQEAQQLGSSDIHIEPYEETSRVRFRIDGVLIERYQLKKEDYPSLVNKIKIKANLDIAEKRLPQDGRIFFENTSQKFDIRVSTLPTLYGEKIVMRLLSSNGSKVDINSLGFESEDLQNYLEGVNRPNGIVLISGPTGSGKTTTLYATLQLLNQTSRNILTIEDPIEFTLEGINQVQLKENIGLNFASTMRTFLRQDPDVIMVGEIRDFDTASMAIRASLTGHSVLSTIHTNKAWGIVARLIDMNVAPYLLADTLNTAVAQRLVRLLCPDCKKEVPYKEKLYPRNFKAPNHLKTHFVPVGCDQCFFTGFRGRKAVYEVIPITPHLSERIKQKELKVDDLLREQKINSLADNAFKLLEKGLTSIKEVYPILASQGYGE